MHLTLFFSPECSPVLCQGAADKAGSVEATRRCSVGKKRGNPFQILATASCWPSHCCKDPSAPCVDGSENLCRLPLKKSIPTAK